MIIPIEVFGGEYDFILFAVWANNPTDPEGQYVRQVWKALHHYADILEHKPVMLVGDFNSNTIWDKKRRTGNHSDVVEHLQRLGIFSAYHLFHDQEQGKEEQPTLYLYRHKNKPCHPDYCFVSKSIAKDIKSVEIGEHNYWSKYSDHVPVVVTFKSYGVE